ncbi:MAG: exonuclease SbcCD subunit D [Candidatus Obscuribacterales bacterium]|nr:exonuclease SbcCD subunit D [Candidatus Obscuribacterales bacterium]
MAIRLIHVSDIHFGSGESHGRINPDTGLNTRFEDFTNALKRTVDYAIANGADIFLFSGDAYRNASPEPIYQKMFALELKRLSASNIKTVLVVGNHDQILRSSQSHAMSVFQSLEVAGVLTIDKPGLHVIDTKNGALQLIGVPHVTRHNLMTMEKYANLSAQQIDDVLIHHVADLLRSYYEDLDPVIPSVVTAHMSLDRAVAGIEEELLLGYTLTFPADMFIDERVDYVALGHIHKHQIIRQEHPAIVYAGSLERVDFGEAKEDKGFVDVVLERKKTSYSFKSISPRPFITVDVDTVGNDDPTAAIVNRVTREAVSGCVLRVRYRVEQERLLEVDEGAIYAAAGACMSVKVQPQLVHEHVRGRLPALTETSVASPLIALSTYLDEVAPDRKDRLLDRAKAVMDEIQAELHKEKCD